jgi:hypothetical protein
MGIKILMRSRVALIAMFLAVCGPSSANFAIFQVNGGAAAPSFTSAWQPMLLGDGGNAQGVHAFPSGTITAHVDSYNNFLYKPSGTTIIGGRTLPNPSWQPLFSTSTVSDSSLWAGLVASINVGGGEIIECQGNTNIFYSAFNGFVWVSTNRGASWARTPQQTNTVVNAGPIQTMWLGCDPADSGGNIVYLQTASSGAFKTINGTNGTSSTWSTVAGITAAGGGGGSIIFDPTSSVIGGVTQRFWISSDGTGIYQTTNGGGGFSLLNSANMPTRSGTLAADKFGQLWSAPGFNAASSTISRFASGTWTSLSPAMGIGETYILAILFDPNTGAVVGNNHVIAVQNFGELSVSINNGTSWVNVTQTAASSAPQPAWLGTAKQDVTGILELNVNGGAIDGAGNVWIPGGISLWTTPNPIVANVVAGSVVWNANSIGVEQLVVNQIIAPPGNSPLTGVWDRAVIYNPNPDSFATIQYPQNASILEDSFSLDYALSTLPVVGGTSASLIVAQVTDAPATSSDGGATWTVWPHLPPGQFSAGMVAAGSPTNWCTVPGNSGGADGTIYCTTNAAASAWVQATVPGTPSFVPANDRPSSIGWNSLTAEKGTAGTFYAVDTAGNVYKTTNANTGNPSFTKVATTPFDGTTIAKAKLQAVPGKPGELFYTGNPTATGHLWKSTNSGSTWAIPAGASTLVNITSYGFGAPKPGGSGYPAIYMVAESGAGTGEFIWASFDGGTTFAKINVPVSQQSFALGSLDYPTWIIGDLNVYGRIYYGFTGSGVAYIDLADACPWVNFSNTNPNASLTGTVTLTAQHSGLVPLSGVQFSVDGVNIGSAQTGAGPYSVSWVTGGVATGAHTLKVAATGANGSGSFSIPITTH